jgi:glyoxylase-like metal-dependent hydrolase (beta-lactamase superfamily II)
VFTSDPAGNRESARTVADLEPETVLFGHGPPLYDGERFVDFVASMGR